MSTLDRSELLDLARERFIENDYRTAEVLLQQAMLSLKRNPEIFHMLGTIYYDQGKFNKAIKTFKKALEIDPTFTDDVARQKFGMLIQILLAGLTDVAQDVGKQIAVGIESFFGRFNTQPRKTRGISANPHRAAKVDIFLNAFS